VIEFKLYVAGSEYFVKTYDRSYRNLMMLIFDTAFPDAFGECRGLGRCGTCVVSLANMPDFLLVRERNENTTLTRLGFMESNMRLSCQIGINSLLDGVVIKVVEEEY
jgi:2Fe-2S ferredoxin